MMAERSYSKYFTPLESDPDIFTTLGHQLGLADHVVFRELFSLDEPCDGKVLAGIHASLSHYTGLRC